MLVPKPLGAWLRIVSKLLGLSAFGLPLSSQGVRLRLIPKLSGVCRWLRLMNLLNAFGLFLSRQGMRLRLRLMILLSAFGLFLSCQG